MIIHITEQVINYHNDGIDKKIGFRFSKSSQYWDPFCEVQVLRLQMGHGPQQERTKSGSPDNKLKIFS